MTIDPHSMEIGSTMMSYEMDLEQEELLLLLLLAVVAVEEESKRNNLDDMVENKDLLSLSSRFVDNQMKMMFQLVLNYY